MIEPETLIEQINEDVVESIRTRLESEGQELEEGTLKQVAIFTIDALGDTILSLGREVLGHCQCLTPITIETLTRGYCLQCMTKVALTVGGPVK